jgi:hypothetical protein
MSHGDAMTHNQRKTAKPRRPALSIKVGGYVLCGGSTASLPSDWYLGEVLWADERDVLIDRSDQTGTRHWRDVLPIESVRAVGSIAELVDIQHAAAGAVRALSQNVRECETALGTARAAVWAKVEELAASGLQVIPLDEAAIAARHLADRAAQEAFDQQLQPWSGP